MRLPKRKCHIDLHIDDASAYTASTIPVANIDTNNSTNNNNNNSANTSSVHGSGGKNKFNTTANITNSAAPMVDSVYFNTEDDELNKKLKLSVNYTFLKKGKIVSKRKTRKNQNNIHTTNGILLHTQESINNMSSYTNPSQRSLLPISSSPLLMNNTNTNTHSPLEVAIKKFKISSEYCYWVDITVQEAKHMYLDTNRGELFCTFWLDLPDICFDLMTHQFNIMVDVLRNLLLALPPQIDEISKYTINTHKDDDDLNLHTEEEKIVKSRRIDEYNDLLQKYDIQFDTLNIQSKTMQIKLKYMMEEFLNFLGGSEVVTSMARLVEVTISKGTWILRMNKSVVVNSDLLIQTITEPFVEAHFTGVKTEFIFHGDRYVYRLDLLLILFLLFNTCIYIQLLFNT